jgi:iron complex outermembrane receptor protein
VTTQQWFLASVLLLLGVPGSVAAEPLGDAAVPASLDAEAVTDEVVVTVTRRAPITASASRVSAREFSFVPRRTAEDALELVPGVTLVQHGSEGKGHQFFLRGFDAIHGADLALDVEGIPVNEWSNIHAQGYIDLGFVIPEVVAAVDVLKGPFSIDQGAFAMAGSAHYTLGVPATELGLRTGLSAGSTGRVRGLTIYSPPDGDGTTFVAAEALHDEGFGQNRGIDRATLLAKARLVDSERDGTLTALASMYLARFELPGALRGDDVALGRVGFRDSYDRGAGGRSARLLAGLSYQRGWQEHELRVSMFAGQRRLELLENFTGFLLDPVFGDRRDQQQETGSFGTDMDLSLRLAPGLRLRTGLGLRADGFEQRQDHVDMSAQPRERERELAGHQALFSAKAALELYALEGVRISAGARADVSRVVVEDGLAGPVPGGGSGTLSALSPRLTVDAALTPAWTLFAAYGRGFRPPEARAFSSFVPARTGIAEDLYTGGEPRLTSTDSFELGARLGDGARGLGASLAGFATFIERESVYDHVSGTNLELNGTRRLGAELEVHARYFDWLELGAFGTWVDARFVQSGNLVPLAPRQTAGLNVMAGRGLGPRGGLRLLGIAPRPLPHGARGATLLSLDATLGWHWQRLHLDLELENVLARRLREGEYHYASHWDPEQAPSQIPVLEFVAGPPLNVRAGISAWF